MLWSLLLFGSKSQTEVMSASWCAWVKNWMLKHESIEKVHLAEGMWRFWSFLPIWEWLVWSALFCFLVPVGAVAQSGQICKYKSHGKKHYWPLQILLFEVLLLSHKLLRNGFRWRKVHFHLRIQCDWWLIWMCKKKKKATWVLLTAELLSLQNGTNGLGLISLAWCGFQSLEIDVLEVCV